MRAPIYELQKKLPSHGLRFVVRLFWQTETFKESFGEGLAALIAQEFFF